MAYACQDQLGGRKIAQKLQKERPTKGFPTSPRSPCCRPLTILQYNFSASTLASDNYLASGFIYIFLINNNYFRGVSEEFSENHITGQYTTGQ